MSSTGDDRRRSGEERPKYSDKRNSSLGLPPAKRACLTACVKEGEEPVQPIGLSRGAMFAPNHLQRLDSLGDGNGDQMFVYPWKGILANIKRTYKDGKFAGESGNKLKEELASKGFNPQKVTPLWTGPLGFTGFAVVDFGKEWEGYRNATLFEKHFEGNQCGKRDFDATHARDPGEKLYGWVAKADDYYSRTVFGYHLKKKDDLKSVSSKVAEDQRKTLTLVSNLENTLETKNSSLQLMESICKETKSKLEKRVRDKDEMIIAHNEKMSSVQQMAHDYLASVCQEHEKVSQQLESQRIEYEKLEQYLDKCQAQNKTERRKVQWQKQKNLRERDELQKQVQQLEQKLDAMQELELEIVRLKGSLQVMGHMQEGQVPGMKEWIETIEKELKKKEEQLEEQELTKQALVVQHGYAKDELQDARNALIESLSNVTLSGNEIGVKWMGALDEKPFQELTKEKYPANEAKKKGKELCSLWEDHLGDSSWHPIKVVVKDGIPKEELNEEDEKLQELRKKLGEEVFEVVTQALKERNEYNASGRYIVPEAWNYKEGRKTSLKEGVLHLHNLWCKLKSKPKRR